MSRVENSPSLEIFAAVVVNLTVASTSDAPVRTAPGRNVQQFGRLPVGKPFARQDDHLSKRRRTLSRRDAAACEDSLVHRGLSARQATQGDIHGRSESQGGAPLCDAWQITESSGLCEIEDSALSRDGQRQLGKFVGVPSPAVGNTLSLGGVIKPAAQSL